CPGSAGVSLAAAGWKPALPGPRHTATWPLTWHGGFPIIRLFALRRGLAMPYTSPSLSSAPPALLDRRAQARFVGRPQLLTRISSPRRQEAPLPRSFFVGLAAFLPLSAAGTHCHRDCRPCLEAGPYV